MAASPELLAALDRHGRSPLSFLVRYDAPWQAFGDGDTHVPYLAYRRAAVGWTDPLCPPGEEGLLLERFVAAMRADGRSVCLVAISEPVARAAIAAGFSALKIGEEPWFDLGAWRRPAGNRGKKLRWAVNHARRQGVSVEAYRPGTGRRPDVEDAVAGVLAGWRAGLGRPEPQSVMRTDPLAVPDRKWIFLAMRGGRAEAFLSCAELPAARGWYLEDVARVPGAANGATELLVVEALAAMRGSGAAGAAFAVAPMRGVGAQIDPRARWLGRVLAFAIHGFDRRYGFRAIARFEERFGPTEWRGRYIAFAPALPRPAAVRAAVRALSA